MRISDWSSDVCSSDLLVTIASGAAHFDFVIFVIASIATRGVRFFLIAGLLWRFGSPIQEFIERRLAVIGWIFLIGLIGGRSEEHTSELQSLMRISYAVFCLKKKKYK